MADALKRADAELLAAKSRRPHPRAVSARTPTPGMPDRSSPGSTPTVSDLSGRVTVSKLLHSPQVAFGAIHAQNGQRTTVNP